MSAIKGRPHLVIRPPRGDLLYRARVSAGLTQADLGALAPSPKSGTPISKTAISHYETGAWSLTDERLAYLLGVIARHGG